MSVLLKHAPSEQKSLKPTFTAIRYDITNLESDFDSFKHSTDEWLIYLDQANRDLLSRVLALEKKLSFIEKMSDSEKLSLLKEI